MTLYSYPSTYVLVFENNATQTLFGRSQIRRRIVLLLLEGTAPRLHLREIQRQVGTTPGTARRELMRLVDAGLVKREAEGRNVYFSIDLSSPVTQPFRDLFRRTFGIPSVIRRHIADVRGIESALVFGSYATGTMQPESDVDLLVVGKPSRDELTERLQAAEAEVGRRISETVFTEAELSERRGRGDRFVTNLDEGPTVRILP